MPSFKPVKEGDWVSIADYNAIAEALERFDNLRVADGSYLRLWDGPDGKHLAFHPPVRTLAILSGSTSPYDMEEVDEDASGAFVTRAVGDSCSGCAYEINGKSGLGGKVVELTWTEAGDWRFQWVGHGCNWTINVTGCNGAAISGATVTLKQGGSTIDSGSTNGSGQITFNVATGTYDIEVTTSITGYDTSTTTGVSHTCNQTTNISLSPDSDHFCLSGCSVPAPKVVRFSDGQGTHALTWVPLNLQWEGTYTTSVSSWSIAGGVCSNTGSMSVTVTCSTLIFTMSWKALNSCPPPFATACHYCSDGTTGGNVSVNAACTFVCNPFSLTLNLPTSDGSIYNPAAYCTGLAAQPGSEAQNTPGGGGLITVTP